jgi:site-specific recombinase XerD
VISTPDCSKCMAVALDAPLVLAFLDHLEKVRKNSIRSRNARLAAIRSFLRFAVLKDPQSLAIIQRALAIPMKRHSRPLVGFLSREEVQAIISAPDPATRTGQRDQALLATLYNTGARVSEAINIKIADLALGASPSIRLHGKGRKDRAVPIWPATALRLRRWLMQIERAQDHPLFPASSGGPLTRSAVTDRLRRAVQAARGKCASLMRKRVSPHTFRHMIGEDQTVRRLVPVFLGKLEQQTETIAIGRHSLWTGVPLANQTIEKELLYQLRKMGLRSVLHRHPSEEKREKRSEAIPISSGMAVTYQYVSETFAWPT